MESWFGRGAKASPQRELVPSPDDHFFESLGPYMLDLEKALQTVREEAYALGAVRSDLSVGWYNFGRALTLIRTADGAGGMGATAGLMGDVICAATASRRRSGLTAAGSKSQNRPEDPIDDYMIEDYSKRIQTLREVVAMRREFRASHTDALEAAKASRADSLLAGTYKGSMTSQDDVRHAEANHQIAQEEVEIERASFEAFTQRALREVNRFRADADKSSRSALAQFCDAREAYHRRGGQFWGDLQSALEGVDFDAALSAAPSLVDRSERLKRDAASALSATSAVPLRPPVRVDPPGATAEEGDIPSLWGKWDVFADDVELEQTTAPFSVVTGGFKPPPRSAFPPSIPR